MTGVHWISWADNTGYAVAGKDYVRGLVGAGVPVRWTPMLPGGAGYRTVAGHGWDDPELSAAAGADIDADVTVIHTVPEYYAQFLAAERRLGRRVFGYTVWELERLPAHWPAVLNQLDGVLVPCRWNRDVFTGSGVRVPIHVVPHLPPDRRPADTADRTRLTARLGAGADAGDTTSIRPGTVVFYTVGFWSHRKALYLTVEAYLRAFPDRQDVLLVVKTTDKDITTSYPTWRLRRAGKRLRRTRVHRSPTEAVGHLSAAHPTPPPVVVIDDETLSDAELAALHELGDCFISLTRTEGWGLGAYAAALRGTPVIMTDYGGQLDYLDADLTRLVGHTMVPVHEPTWSANYRAGDRWAEPDLDQAVAHLRSVRENLDAARADSAELARRLQLRFSRESILADLTRALA